MTKNKRIFKSPFGSPLHSCNPPSISLTFLRTINLCFSMNKILFSGDTHLTLTELWGKNWEILEKVLWSCLNVVLQNIANCFSLSLTKQLTKIKMRILSCFKKPLHTSLVHVEIMLHYLLCFQLLIINQMNKTKSKTYILYFAYYID